MINEQVKRNTHYSCIYCMWNLNQEPELPVPKQGFQPCQNVLPCTRILSYKFECSTADLCTNIMVCGGNSNLLDNTFLLVWPATCVTSVLVSSCCFFAVSGSLYFVLYMSCVHKKNFLAVSQHQSRATDPKVGVKGCD